MSKQKTINSEVQLSGVGLHTGNKATITFKPAPCGNGVTFVRSDLEGSPPIKADVSHVIDVSRGTTIGINGVRVATIEHVLAAIGGLDIDNVVVDVDSNEVPFADGSALPFVEKLIEAGIVEQDEERKDFVVEEAITFTDGDITITALPADSLKLSVTIDYEHPALNTQHRTFSVGRDNFAEEIAGARTYCFLHEVEALKELGLIKGGSLENAIVIGDEGVLNDSVRFPDEFVRHKILDLLGDLMLLGMPLRGHVIALKSGHASHVKFTNLIRDRINNSGSDMKKDQNKKVVASPPIPVGEDIVLTVNDIMGILPHRYPMLMVDRITSLVPDEYVIGIKNVTANEPCFTGHWPENPVMPGVLMLEAMAQVGGVLLLSKPERRGLTAYFMGIDKAKFRRPVVPGDQLVFRVEITKLRSKVVKVKGVATVDGQIAVEAEMKFYLAPQKD